MPFGPVLDSDRYFMNLENTYSDRELDERFTSLQDSFEVRLDAQTLTLGRIETQTTKTNGHVADAFKEINALKGDNKYMKGGIAASTFFIIMITGVVGYWFNDYIKHRDKEFSQEQIQSAVAAGIDQALKSYEPKK